MTSESGAARALRAVSGEVAAALEAVPQHDLAAAYRLLADRGHRWFFCGQGRSGLITQMIAMRLMHVGYDAHVVGDTTTPAITEDDRLMAISGSGETPATLHIPDRAHDLGAQILAVTAGPDSSLVRLAQAVLEPPHPEQRANAATHCSTRPRCSSSTNSPWHSPTPTRAPTLR